MYMTFTAPVILFGFLFAPSIATAQTAQASTETAMIKSPDKGNWMPMPDLFPKGAEMQVLQGDPAKGPATSCTCPPGRHTA